ncbi:hypothetical protein ACYPKM_03010 [Pseudomonas aeruginosa]
MDMTAIRHHAVAQRWLDLYLGLLEGRAEVWESLHHSEITSSIAKEWAAIPFVPAETPAIDLRAPLSPKGRRLLMKAIRAMLSLKDGRLCTMMECLDVAIQRHPNQFMLRVRFAEAEDKLAKMQPAEKDTVAEATLREFAFSASIPPLPAPPRARPGAGYFATA